MYIKTTCSNMSILIHQYLLKIHIVKENDKNKLDNYLKVEQKCKYRKM